MSAQNHSNDFPSPDDHIPSIEVTDPGDRPSANAQGNSDTAQDARDPSPNLSAASVVTTTSSSSNATASTNASNRNHSTTPPTSVSSAGRENSIESDGVQHAGSLFSTTTGPHPEPRSRSGSRSPLPPNFPEQTTEDQINAGANEGAVDSEAETDIFNEEEGGVNVGARGEEVDREHRKAGQEKKPADGDEASRVVTETSDDE